MEMFWKCSEKISEIIDVKCRALFFAISTLGKVSLKTWRRRCCYKGTESRYSRVRRNVGLSIHSRDVRIMKKKKKKRKRERERERERERRPSNWNRISTSDWRLDCRAALFLLLSSFLPSSSSSFF